MTTRGLILMTIALGGLAGWAGGILAAVNWFPEEGGGPWKAIVLASSWASALVGVVATIAFGISVWRTPRV